MGKWSDHEINVLYANYETKGAVSVIDAGVDKSIATIRVKASKMGLKVRNEVVDKNRGKWSDEELDFLVNMYPVEGAKGIIAKYPYRSVRAIESKASSMGLKLNKGVKSGLWSDYEIDILKSFYTSKGVAFIIQLGVERSYNAIVSKANKLGLSREEGTDV